jgi:hypothetical protein
MAEQRFEEPIVLVRLQLRPQKLNKMKKSSQFIMKQKEGLVQWHRSFRTKQFNHYGQKTYSTIRGR